MARPERFERPTLRCSIQLSYGCVFRYVRGLNRSDASELGGQAALPAMFSLLDQVSWPSDFGVFELGSVLIRESSHPFSPFSVHRSMVGRRRSLVRSALGKAILAASPPALRREMLDLTARSSYSRRAAHMSVVW